jgi:hypothetical protein
MAAGSCCGASRFTNTARQPTNLWEDSPAKVGLTELPCIHVLLCSPDLAKTKLRSFDHGATLGDDKLGTDASGIFLA